MTYGTLQPCNILPSTDPVSLSPRLSALLNLLLCEPSYVLSVFPFHSAAISQGESCPSKLFMSEDIPMILKSVIEHKHSPRKNLTKVTISSNLKRKAVDKISKRPLKLIREEVQSSVMN
ncbi:hypothetical protein QTP88_002098 [Uroleucon formosanum]